MKNLIFLAGIHGAGKNFILNQVHLPKSIIHLTASDVLGWNSISKDQKDKRVLSISETQDLLVTHLKEIVKDDQYYILNGHVTLLNKNGEIERVPETTFYKINPKVLIVKKAEPKIICERLKKRDNKEWDINMISSMQDEEVKYTKEIALKLRVPFYQLEDRQEKLLNSIIISKWQYD